jgi:hypothetical protein
MLARQPVFDRVLRAQDLSLQVAAEASSCG